MKTIIEMAKLCDLHRVCGPLDTLLDDEWESLHRFATLVKAAHVDELLKGVEMPEPYAHLCLLPTKDAGPTNFFTAPSDPRGFAVITTDQLRDYAAYLVLREREECAKVCEDMWGDRGKTYSYFASAIRNRSNK